MSIYPVPLVQAASHLEELTPELRSQLLAVLTSLAPVIPPTCPPFHYNRGDDGSVGLEMMLPWARLGISLEVDPRESGWHLVRGNGVPPEMESGALHPVEGVDWGTLFQRAAIHPPAEDCALRRVRPGLYSSFRRAANSLSMRYCGHPVYLVGSAVESENPRDIDLVIVLPETLFVAMYGDPDDTYITWRDGFSQSSPSAIWRRWARDCARQSEVCTLRLRCAVDLKVQTDTEQSLYAHLPYHRLDCAFRTTDP